MTSLPETMRAVVIDRFGGPEVLRVARLPVPHPAEGEVVVRVAYAGVGQWDPFEREGGYAQMLGVQPAFPYVLGSEGSGTVAAVGRGVEGLEAGQPVIAVGFLNPRGGFYAEYAAVDADLVVPIPPGLDLRAAAVIAGVGLTALRGLDDVLGVRAGETLAVVGASGGVGHLAVQLAAQQGVRVLAVASGGDGTALAARLGAEAVVDGRGGDVAAALAAFAPEGLDAALLAAGGPVAEVVAAHVAPHGRVAFPTGVVPPAEPAGGAKLMEYQGEPDRDILQPLVSRIAAGGVTAHVDALFPLEAAADAHRAVERHHLGKLGLRVQGG